MRSALLVVLAVSLGVTLPSDAKGTLNYKGKSKDFAIALKYAHFVKGPDTMDPKTTIRRVILSSTDLTAKIQACKTMDCSDDDLTEGIEIDIVAGGPRLLYWLVVNGGLVQYSGTQKPAALTTTADTADHLAGKITFDDSAAGGAKLDVTFDATLLKTFDKAR